MLTSTYLVSTDKRLRAYLIGGLLAVLMAAGSVAYEVRSGDTLSAIASEHGVSLQAILDNNDISNPDLIRPGLQITIPGEGGESGRVHVVAKGETLSNIASRYKASLSGLVEANELSNPNLIRIGQKLTIPGGGSGGGGTSSGSASFHVVRAGDTLGSIASKYGLSVSQLTEANGITNPSLIHIGSRLALSGEAFVADSAGGGGGSATSHTVAAGETLGSIAGQYGIALADLAQANDITDVNRIRVGQELTVPGAGWVCPVVGGTYVNDWGFPRQEERFHEGTDIFAPRGTEVVAPVGGEIKLITGTVGGLQFYLYGDDGTTYIGTHLEAFGRSGRVEAGQVIGYVGDTGNARGRPHLHLRIGRVHDPAAHWRNEPLDPYPLLVRGPPVRP